MKKINNRRYYLSAWHKFLFILFIFGLTANLYAGRIIERPEHECYLCLPKAISSEEPLPVLVTLPGWGVKAKNDINLWAFPADKRGFLLIELDINYSFMRIDRDIRQLFERIQNIISSASKEYKIDKNKVFIAGTSAGGMMSIALSLLYPGEFKAIGVISGGRLGFGAKKHLQNAKGQLFYLYHGRRDKSIPIGEFYSIKKKLEKQGAIIEFKVLKQGEHTLPSSCYREVVDYFYQLSELSP